MERVVTTMSNKFIGLTPEELTKVETYNEIKTLVSYLTYVMTRLVEINGGKSFDGVDKLLVEDTLQATSYILEHREEFTKLVKKAQRSVESDYLTTLFNLSGNGTTSFTDEV